MGINSQGVAYDFGQMGSGHLKAIGTRLYAPTGKVIVAITMLESVAFEHLVADDTYIGSGSATVDDGVSFFGTGTQFLANGEDDDGDAVTSVPVATTVQFPEGMTIYGRWTSVKLQDFDSVGSSDYTHGIIVYYGPA